MERNYPSPDDGVREGDSSEQGEGINFMLIDKMPSVFCWTLNVAYQLTRKCFLSRWRRMSVESQTVCSTCYHRKKKEESQDACEMTEAHKSNIDKYRDDGFVSCLNNFIVRKYTFHDSLVTRAQEISNKTIINKYYIVGLLCLWLEGFFFVFFFFKNEGGIHDKVISFMELIN